MFNQQNLFFSPLGTSRMIQVFMNFIPLLGVIFMDWNVFALMYVFWLETLGLSFFNALKIFFAKGSESPGPHIIKAFSYMAFRVFILLFYLLFIIIFIGVMISSKQGEGYEWGMYLVLAEPSFKFTVLMFFFIKLVEFIYFYFIKDERATTDPAKYGGFFDARIVIIHVVLVGGVFAFQYISEKLGARMGLIAFAVIFTLIKTLVEYFASIIDEQRSA